MKYFPKSQIIPNQYTNGEELQYVLTKEEYVGYYYETSKGKKYVGKNPNNGNGLELEPLVDPINNQPTLDIPGEDSTFSPQTDPAYNSLQEVNVETDVKVLPYYDSPKPTELDIQVGEYTRYFCKKSNECLFIEINFEIYNLLKTKSKKIVFQLYPAISLQWKLTGDNIQETNAKIVAKAEKDNKWYGFTNYFKGNFGSPI